MKELMAAVVYTVLCAVPDCTHRRIPVLLSAAGMLAGAAFVFYRICLGEESWYTVLLSALPGVALWTLSFLTEGKIGRGDGDMVLVIGLLMGWEGCMAALCAACLFAAVFSGIGLMIKRLKRNSRIPFAPFLSAACLLLGVLCLTGGTGG